MSNIRFEIDADRFDPQAARMPGPVCAIRAGAGIFDGPHRNLGARLPKRRNITLIDRAVTMEAIALSLSAGIRNVTYTRPGTIGSGLALRHDQQCTLKPSIQIFRTL